MANYNTVSEHKHNRTVTSVANTNIQLSIK